MKQPSQSEKPKAATKKKLTWNEQKEWDSIEERIADAEDKVRDHHLQMEDPAILRDPKRLDEVCRAMHDAQELVRKLYARWEELEQKQG